MKLIYVLFVSVLGQKRSMDQMSEKRKARLRMKMQQNASSTTSTTTSTTSTITTTTTTTTTTTEPTRPKVPTLVRRPVQAPRRQQPRAKKYIGSINERLEESLANGFVAAEFGGRTLQHCFSCEQQVLPEHKEFGTFDIWKKCIEDGALQECYGMDKACETVERRYGGTPYYVRMGCKQQTSCIQQVPSVSNWPFNNGECDPQSTGLSKCASCCDNTKQAKTRACNLDTYMDKKLGRIEHWNVTSDILMPQ